MYNTELLKRCTLFSGLEDSQTEECLKYISPAKKIYKREELIFISGEPLHETEIVLSGCVQILKEDADGGNVILADLHPGDMFGESFALSGELLTVSARSACESTTVLFIPIHAILPGNGCPHSDILSANLIISFARKNLFLTSRIEHLTKRTLKDKVMAYLTDCSLKAGSNSFTIPFDRQAMADYLAADRSALSHVLSRLQAEGRIAYHKNRFTVNSTEHSCNS